MKKNPQDEVYLYLEDFEGNPTRVPQSNAKEFLTAMEKASVAYLDKTVPCQLMPQSDGEQGRANSCCFCQLPVADAVRAEKRPKVCICHACLLLTYC